MEFLALKLGVLAGANNVTHKGLEWVLGNEESNRKQT
jgi:hypothetical protein